MPTVACVPPMSDLSCILASSRCTVACKSDSKFPLQIVSPPSRSHGLSPLAPLLDSALPATAERISDCFLENPPATLGVIAALPDSVEKPGLADVSYFEAPARSSEARL